MNTIVSDASARGALSRIANYSGGTDYSTIHGMRGIAKDALASLPSPEGEWVLVPREPTEAMERAAFDVCEIAPGTSGFETGTYARNAIYRAMLSATPSSDGER